jgi:hypothetical protein
VNAYYIPYPILLEVQQVRPETLFPDGLDSIDVGGTQVRKGSIASFVHNALALERLDPGSSEYERTAAEMRETIPALRAVRVFDVFSLRSQRAATVVLEVDPLLISPRQV